LVCFSYNVGLGALGKSTLLQKLLISTNDPTIKDEFLKWNKGGGKVLPGLTKRRQAEWNLFNQK
jgi:lysozyme